MRKDWRVSIFLQPALSWSPVRALSVTPLNRRLLEDALGSHLERKSDTSSAEPSADVDILDVILDEDLREEFIGTCRNLILFDFVYENMIADLVSMAREANESKRMPRDFVAGLLDKSIQDVLKLRSV